jgi:O-antigen/teichoic acid export membrane protein
MRGEGYFRNTAYIVVERALRLVLLLVVGIYVTRFLGPERFGQLSYVVSFVALLGAVSSLGIDGILVRELVARPSDANSLLGTAFTIKFFGALVISAVIVICSILSGNDSRTTVYILIVAAGLIFQAFSVVDLYFQATVSASRAAVARFFQVLISSLLRLLAALTGQPLEIFVFLVFLDQVTLALLYWISYKLSVSSPWKWNWDACFARKLIAQAKFIVLADVVISVLYKIDQVMIKQMLGYTDVGLYSAATTFS